MWEILCCQWMSVITVTRLELMIASLLVIALVRYGIAPVVIISVCMHAVSWAVSPAPPPPACRSWSFILYEHMSKPQLVVHVTHWWWLYYAAARYLWCSWTSRRDSSEGSSSKAGLMGRSGIRASKICLYSWISGAVRGELLHCLLRCFGQPWTNSAFLCFCGVLFFPYVCP